MAREKEETKEAMQLIRTLKDIRLLMKKDIKAHLYVDKQGIFIGSIHAMETHSEGEEAVEEEYHIKFMEGRDQVVKKQSLQLDYLG